VSAFQGTQGGTLLENKASKSRSGRVRNSKSSGGREKRKERTAVFLQKTEGGRKKIPKRLTEESERKCERHKMSGKGQNASEKKTGGEFALAEKRRMPPRKRGHSCGEGGAYPNVPLGLGRSVNANVTGLVQGRTTERHLKEKKAPKKRSRNTQ